MIALLRRDLLVNSMGGCARPSSTLIKSRLNETVFTRRAAIREQIAKIDALTPYVAAPLTDTFGRRHNYLRISLTERCNLRCFYCMPSEGVELSPKPSLLSDDEIFRIARLFVRNGVTKIRLTGGEPTVRKGLVDLVGERALARLNTLRVYGLKAIGMTSNGLVLHRYLPALVESGLTHVNISLDTLNPFTFEIMTRRRGHDAVLRSLEEAIKSEGLKSVKVNVVVIQGLNDQEVLDFVEMTRDRKLSIRFIEYMPFTGNKWDKSKMLSSAQLLERIVSRYPRTTKLVDEDNDTARSYHIPGFRGSFGFISSMSDHFCGSCNRLRLTADGKIKVCLFGPEEVSLRDLLRSGADNTTLLETVRKAVRGKKEKHAGMEDIDVITNRPMILIGACTRSSSHHALYSTRANDDAPLPSSPLTHIDERGRPSMVDVSRKSSTSRNATARGRIYLPRTAYELITPPSTSPDSDRHPGSGRPALEKAREKARAKGDVLTVAQLAAIMACKRTAELIPLCHPLSLTHVAVSLTPEEHVHERPAADTGDAHGGTHTHEYSVLCTATVRCSGQTGVEMEALTAVSVGLLTVWDMLKAVAGREMVISDIVVSHKSGGKGGDFVRLE
ncbi:hypothetical protein K488DRAFT_77561 [Vararia minispora EC-137]|uniref:Uncharacterized protein n=1 Tax=Vararia minispora EC-137 TaxID=1314806 RepID=A0ACB8QQL4_9AGAM|nr:hypothetical protein K488DRAFT_77561 [Vararia minispora EC-137]